ncbi:hypothetical protein [Acetomicrobium sp. S15 = DSM 107314]
MTILIVVFGEILPKSIAIVHLQSYNDVVARFVSLRLQGLGIYTHRY